jgi:hypothetical protein
MSLFFTKKYLFAHWYILENKNGQLQNFTFIKKDRLGHAR